MDVITYPGARPTEEISIKFQIRSKYFYIFSHINPIKNSGQDSTAVLVQDSCAVLECAKFLCDWMSFI